jgi:hypothetical protein
MSGSGRGSFARGMTDLLLKNILMHLEFTWGGKNLSEDGSIRRQYIASLHAADEGDYAPLLAFVRT